MRNSMTLFQIVRVLCWAKVGCSGRHDSAIHMCRRGVTTFAWRPRCQYDVAATQRGDTVLASDCRGRDIPGCLPGYKGIPEKFEKKEVCLQSSFPVLTRALQTLSVNDRGNRKRASKGP